MATLVEQIRQMIDALEVVDPKAAAEFRGASVNRQIPDAPSSAAILNTALKTPLNKKQDMQSQNKSERVSEKPAHNSIVNQLQISPITDNLIKGIIYSEILSKPVSKRHIKQAIDQIGTAIN